MIKLLFALVIIIRIALSFQSGFFIDVSNWKAWADRLISVGPQNFYSNGYFADYLPGYLYILLVSGKLFNFALPGVGINSFNFEFLLKLISTIFDVAAAYYIYKIIKRYKPSLAQFAALFYLINPALIFNSNLWGQIEGISSFFLLSSTYYLIEKKNKLNWSFLLAIGGLVKPQSLALLPIALIEHFRLFKIIPTFKNSILLFLLMLVFSSPFFISDPLFGLPKLVIKSINVYPYSSLYAFNFWGFFDWWKSDARTFFSISQETIGIILYSISIILIAIPLLRKKIKNEYLYIAFSLVLFSFYFFPTRIHERYLFSYLPFLLIAAAINKSKFLFISYLVSTLIHLVNLWYVYYFYNYLYKNPQALQNPLYVLVGNEYRIFIILLFLFFSAALLIYYRMVLKQGKVS